MKNLPLLLGTAALSLASCPEKRQNRLCRHRSRLPQQSDSFRLLHVPASDDIPRTRFATLGRRTTPVSVGKPDNIRPGCLRHTPPAVHRQPLHKRTDTRRLDPIFLPRKSFLVPYQAGQFIADPSAPPIPKYRAPSVIRSKGWAMHECRYFMHFRMKTAMNCS